MRTLPGEICDVHDDVADAARVRMFDGEVTLAGRGVER